MSSIAVEQNQTQSNIKPVAILIAFVVAGFTGLFSETALNMALGNRWWNSMLFHQPFNG